MQLQESKQRSRSHERRENQNACNLGYSLTKIDDSLSYNFVEISLAEQEQKTCQDAFLTGQNIKM
jgi:hypothetical protein